MNVSLLKEDPEYFEHLGADVWLMDDHRWAFYAWAMYIGAHPATRLDLVHLDYHWDGVNDFHDRPAEMIKLIQADESRLYEMVLGNKLIRCDSFIAPAVIRNYLNAIKFYCVQSDGIDEGLDVELLERYRCEQEIYRDHRVLAKSLSSDSVALDLCLDLFNRSEKYSEGDIWPIEEVHEFLSEFRPAFRTAKVVTLSLSFGYSGTEHDTRRLANHVVPMVLDSRK